MLFCSPAHSFIVMTHSLFKSLLFLAGCCLPSVVASMPAWPGGIELTNPDGSKIIVLAHGDKHFHYLTDSERSYIIEKDSEGFYRKATRNGKALAFNEENVSALREESLRRERVFKSPSRLAAIDDEGRTFYPTKGNDIHSLVVLLAYPDTPFSIPDPKGTIERMLNEPGYSLYGGHGSAADYFTACSEGQFTPVFDVSEIVVLPENRSWYTGKNVKDFENWGYALKYALEELDRQGMDFSRYDYDNDGIIDTVYFIYAGNGQHDTMDPTCIWPHQGNYSAEEYGEVNVDGKIFMPYACSNELTAPHRIPAGESAPYLDGVGVFCHEYSHVLGIPDMYNTGYDFGGFTTPETWSVMDQGPYNNGATQPPLYSAYEKWVCHWTEFIEAEDGEFYSLAASADKGKAVRIPTASPNEYFIIESRSSAGWDASLGQEGLLIWHIDYDKDAWETNQVNSRSNPGVSIHYSVSPKGDVTWPGNSNLIYSFPESANPLKTIRKDYDFAPFITRMNYDKESGTGSFEYNVVKERPNARTFIHTPIRNDDDSKGFSISWAPYEGADGYLINIWRDTKKGRVYLSGCQDRIIVDSTELSFNNLTSAWWQGDVKATVTVICGLPALESSEEMVFTPMNLDTSGIDSMEEESPIYAEGNGIVAPDEARIFTISGAEVGRGNLAPGIYLVVYDGATRKVAVK